MKVSSITCPGVRGDTLLGFLTALGTLRTLALSVPSAKLSWSPHGGGWVPTFSGVATILSPEDLAETVFSALSKDAKNHPIMRWASILGETDNQAGLFEKAAREYLGGDTESAAFTTMCALQLPVPGFSGPETFDNLFRAARKDYYPGNLEKVINDTGVSHIYRTLTRAWDYADAMANQSLRLDHGDDRRHAYQWNAPTSDPARQRSGCMLGANRLAIEAFPFFPCIMTSRGPTCAAFQYKSASRASITWPIWTVSCDVDTVLSILQLDLSGDVSHLTARRVAAIFNSQRIPWEKNKVFLPPNAP